MVTKPLTSRRLWSALGVCLSAAIFIAILAPLIGSTEIDLQKALARESPHYDIFFYARVPRVLLALLAGGALALAGVLFQALLRDALATPETLGVSSGAALGAVLAICFGGQRIPLWPAALAGAGLTLAVVVAIASEGRRMSSFTLLLSGVSINSISMAGILLLQSFTDFSQSFGIVRWLMGGIDAVDYASIGWLAVAVSAGSLFVFWRARDWNLLAVGEDWAASRGVSTGNILLSGYLAGSLLAGAVTSLTGPILFVGLIVPHALRLWVGADHRVLAPCAFFAGAAFLALCDTLARTLLAPVEIPVGVITALLGGPFFIWLLRSKRRSLWI
jgi:iron complex transport system permease protein